jgi:hypothetical protein
MMNYSLYPIITKLLLGFFSIAPLSHAAEPTLCKSNETPIFSCGFKNKKIVSICYPKNSQQGYVDYRFGNKSKVELTYSANPHLPEQKFHRGEVVYANNSDDMIWFKKGNYRYSVYSPMRGGPGLSVSLNGEVVTRLECNNSGRGATEALKTPSPFIVEHGTGDLTKFEKLWGD